MANYYRRVVPGYAILAEPLTALTKKNAPFDWNERCQRGFDSLKTALVSAEVMAYPHVGKPYRLYTDACDTAVNIFEIK